MKVLNFFSSNVLLRGAASCLSLLAHRIAKYAQAIFSCGLSAVSHIPYFPRRSTNRQGADQASSPPPPSSQEASQASTVVPPPPPSSQEASQASTVVPPSSASSSEADLVSDVPSPPPASPPEADSASTDVSKPPSQLVETSPPTTSQAAVRTGSNILLSRFRGKQGLSGNPALICLLQSRYGPPLNWQRTSALASSPQNVSLPSSPVREPSQEKSFTSQQGSSPEEASLAQETSNLLVEPCSPCTDTSVGAGQSSSTIFQTSPSPDDQEPQVPTDEQNASRNDQTVPIDNSRTEPLQFLASLVEAPVANAIMKTFPAHSVFTKTSSGWSVKTSGAHSFTSSAFSFVRVTIPEILNIQEQTSNLTFPTPIAVTLELKTLKDELAAQKAKQQDKKSSENFLSNGWVSSLIQKSPGESLTLYVYAINKGSDDQKRSLKISTGTSSWSPTFSVPVPLNALADIF